MATTMKWLAEQTIMPDFKWLAGRGGGANSITGVNIMDNPDTIRFLTGGELILSTGYFLKNDAHLRQNFIKDLAGKQCAGLGIALKRYLDMLPPEMLQDADRLNFPIISVPFEQNFSEISMIVYREILKEEISDTETIYEMYRKLNEVIIHEHSLKDTMQMICELTKCPVVLANNRLEYMESSSVCETGGQDMEETFLFTASEAEHLLDEYDTKQFQVSTKAGRILFPIRDKEHLLGFLCFTGHTESFSARKYNFVFSILSLLAIELVNNTLKQQSNLQKQNHFIRNILSGNLSELDMVSQCNLYGFDYTSPRICAVIHPEIGLDKQFEERNEIRGKIDLILRGQISLSDRTIYKFNYDQNIILFFVSAPSSTRNSAAEIKEWTSRLTDRLNSQNLPCSIGLSESLQGIDTVKSSFLEAMDAMRLGKKIHPEQQVFYYSDDIIYHILSCTMSIPHLKAFYLNTLSPVVEFDRKNNGCLFETLSMYFACGFNIKETAQALYIHRNTMASRLEKIKELVPCNFTDFNEAAVLLLSFYAYKLLGKPEK